VSGLKFAIVPRILGPFYIWRGGLKSLRFENSTFQEGWVIELKDRTVLKVAVGASVVLIPTLFRKPSATFWAMQMLVNGLSNYTIDVALTKQKFIEYPVRFAPKDTKTQLVYDCLICPYISVWLSQYTRKASLGKIFGASVLFAIPQMLLEYWALKKTDLIRYGNNWSLVRTFFAILLAKLLGRSYSAISYKLMHRAPVPRTE
jgi:hypothetical protein